ncbi:MAG: hypothetical protein HY832_01085 [Candidatus Aenigmarchaeota archaeon]|nr:hypothetical protein [Candidatus Aenigmarchaeota archaeon]
MESPELNPYVWQVKKRPVSWSQERTTWFGILERLEEVTHPKTYVRGRELCKTRKGVTLRVQHVPACEGLRDSPEPFVTVYHIQGPYASADLYDQMREALQTIDNQRAEDHERSRPYFEGNLRETRENPQNPDAREALTSEWEKFYSC